MKKRSLPELPDTGRHYVENTVRARLANPGVERFAGRSGGRGRLGLAALLVAALVGAMIWLSR